MNNLENIRERLNKLDLTEEMLLEIEETIVSLNLNEDSVNNLLSILERVAVQNYIRILLKHNILK